MEECLDGQPKWLASQDGLGIDLHQSSVWEVISRASSQTSADGNLRPPFLVVALLFG